MSAGFEALVQRQRAMVEQTRLFVGNRRQEECVALTFIQDGPLEEGDHLVKHRDVAGDLNVMGGDIGEPAAVVGDAGANTAPGLGQPPMLNVAFNELPRRGPEKMLAGDVRPRHAQRHDILQLVAEAIGAARLIEGGSGPYPACQRLVGKPAVEENVQRAVGRLDLNRPKCVIPLPGDVGEHRVEVSSAVLHEERLRLFLGRRLPEEEDNFRGAEGAEVHLRLQRSAGIEACADAIGQDRPRRQGKRPIDRAVAAQEFRTIAGPRGLPTRQVHESDALAK